MKAAITFAAGEGFVMGDVEIDDPIGREVLIDVKASGLCHSDLTVATHGMGFPLPAVLGHEVAGVVAAIGPDVTTLSVGDRVMGTSLQACGSCADCLDGRPFQCSNAASLLRRPDQPPRLSHKGQPIATYLGVGGFAERALMHENQVVQLPANMPFVPASLIGCSVITGVGAALNSAAIRAGDSVVIVGAGGVGLNAISGAVLASAGRIIAVDIDDAKLDKAQAFGATDTINSSSTDPVAEVRRLTGAGAHHVIDLVGLEKVAGQSIDMLAPGGGLYVLGVAGPTDIVPLKIVDAVLRQLKVQGVQLGSTNLERDVPYYANAYLNGTLNLDDLVSARIRLDEIPHGYELLKDSSNTRVVIEID